MKPKSAFRESLVGYNQSPERVAGNFSFRTQHRIYPTTHAARQLRSPLLKKEAVVCAIKQKQHLRKLNPFCTKSLMFLRASSPVQMQKPLATNILDDLDEIARQEVEEAFMADVARVSIDPSYEDSPLDNGTRLGTPKKNKGAMKSPTGTTGTKKTVKIKEPPTANNSNNNNNGVPMNGVNSTSSGGDTKDDSKKKACSAQTQEPSSCGAQQASCSSVAPPPSLGHKEADWTVSGEFHSIEQEDEPEDFSIALDRRNMGKNRYGNALPNPETRVKLKHVGQDGSDYINANYLEGVSKGVRYIAAQAPLPSTFADFWLMIFEQQTRVIMMLTKLQEKDRPKADVYWPRKGKIYLSCYV